MKIYFSGAHSTGKSSLTLYISKKYNLPMITETARMILSEQELQIDRLRADIELVDQYERDVFYRQIQEENKYDEFVSDRTAIDALAYTGQHSRILPELINSQALKDYLQKLQSSPDNLIFFIRPSKNTLHADGVREKLSWDGIITIDAQIKLLFEMFGIKYFQINTDNMQERVRFVENVIELVRNK